MQRNLRLSTYNKDSDWFWASDLSLNLREMQCAKSANLLSLLFSAHDEVRLHTPMLAWLLDPSGDHGLGTKPLKGFLRALGLEESVPGEIDPQSVEVWRERSFLDSDNGRVDLMIKWSGGVIIIENKLYAADQKSQLWRYRRVLDQEVRSASRDLFYLTLDGSAPSALSCSAPNAKGGQGDLQASDYRCISYRSEVRDWLVALISDVPEENVRTRQCLEQYLEIVMEVTGMHSREDARKELDQSGLKEHIQRNPDDAAVLAGLTRSVRFLHAKLLEDLVNAVQERLKSESSLVSVENAARKDRLDWSVYEAWAGGKKAKGALLFKVQSVSDPALQNVHLVIGLDAADKFWVGLGHFVDGEHQENVVSGDRFGGIPGHNSNQWWLSWVTISELEPAAFDGDRGVGRLAVDQNLAELAERVLGICWQYLAILAKEA